MINARATFTESDMKQIKIAAAFEGITQKSFIERATISLAIQTIAKLKKK